jgi:hypothetical protein
MPIIKQLQAVICDNCPCRNYDDEDGSTCNLDFDIKYSKKYYYSSNCRLGSITSDTEFENLFTREEDLIEIEEETKEEKEERIKNYNEKYKTNCLLLKAYMKDLRKSILEPSFFETTMNSQQQYNKRGIDELTIKTET